MTCDSGKRSFGRVHCHDEARRLRMKPYRCHDCGKWHLSKGLDTRWRRSGGEGVRWRRMMGNEVEND